MDFRQTSKQEPTFNFHIHECTVTSLSITLVKENRLRMLFAVEC